MRNRNLQIGVDFMEKSLYDLPSLQQGIQPWDPKKEENPLPFKVYRKTEHYPLHQMPPLTLGDARRPFQEDRFTGSAHGRDQLDFESLSTLLYYTYGFSRHDEGVGVLWPFHRFVPSARCFFPAELYLWLPQTGPIPAGIYHYDNLHHRLALLRPGEYRDLLAQAVDSELDPCLCVLLISALFWKNAYLYLNFSYRLCTQEAGLVTSNALLVAGTLGFSGRVHYQFLDQPLNRLLGFEPGEESLLSVVPLYAGQTEGSREAAGTGPPLLQRLGATTAQPSLSRTIAPVEMEGQGLPLPLHLPDHRLPDYLKTSTFDHQRCALLTEIDQHTFLEERTEMVTQTTPPATTCLTTEERIAPPAPLPEGMDLAQALQVRSSGDVDFQPRRVPLSQGAFWEIVRYSLAAYHSDLQYAPAPPRLQLYLVIQQVKGMEAGLYRLCTDCGLLHVIKRGDFSIAVQVVQSKPNITSSAANLICYLVGDYAAASQLFGNRAYRILHLEAGLIGQRIAVMSAAQGLTARYSNSYSVAACKALLKLSETPLLPLAELIIGYEPPSRQAGSSFRFSLLL